MLRAFEATPFVRNWGWGSPNYSKQCLGARHFENGQCDFGGHVNCLKDFIFSLSPIYRVVCQFNPGKTTTVNLHTFAAIFANWSIR